MGRRQAIIMVKIKKSEVWIYCFIVSYLYDSCIGIYCHLCQGGPYPM